MIVLTTRIGDRGASTFFQVVNLFSGLLVILYACALVRIVMRIWQLKRL